MPIFLGALLLSMDNWKHDTFFMLYFKKKEKRKKIITVLCLSKLTNILLFLHSKRCISHHLGTVTPYFELFSIFVCYVIIIQPVYFLL